MSRYWFWKSDVQIVWKFVYAWFLKLLHLLKKLEKVFESVIVKKAIT